MTVALTTGAGSFSGNRDNDTVTPGCRLQRCENVCIQWANNFSEWMNGWYTGMWIHGCDVNPFSSFFFPPECSEGQLTKLTLSRWSNCAFGFYWLVWTQTVETPERQINFLKRLSTVQCDRMARPAMPSNILSYAFASWTTRDCLPLYSHTKALARMPLSGMSNDTCSRKTDEVSHLFSL